MSGHERDAVGIFAPTAASRTGTDLRVARPPGDYVDLWAGQSLRIDAQGEAVMPAPVGIALLVGPRLRHEIGQR